MNFSKIAILGPGLLGGSIALAVRARKPEVKIAIWARREEAVAEVQAAQIANIATVKLEDAVRDAGLVVLCVPVGSMPELAGKIVPFLAPDAIITDVGSVKSSVVQKLTPIFAERGHFVGSHPMAGSEQTGLAAARADLFENAACIVTPEERSDRASLQTVTTFWELLGCCVQTLPPAEHDEIVARVSHLPHLLAAALVNLAVAEHPRALDFSGPGFRDTTRVASGPPAMWAEILTQNRAPITQSIHAMIEKLREVLKLLDAADAGALEQFLADAKARRDDLKRKTK